LVFLVLFVVSLDLTTKHAMDTKNAALRWRSAVEEVK